MLDDVGAGVHPPPNILNELQISTTILVFDVLTPSPPPVYFHAYNSNAIHIHEHTQKRKRGVDVITIYVKLTGRAVTLGIHTRSVRDVAWRGKDQQHRVFVLFVARVTDMCVYYHPTAHATRARHTDTRRIAATAARGRDRTIVMTTSLANNTNTHNTNTPPAPA